MSGDRLSALLDPTERARAVRAAVENPSDAHTLYMECRAGLDGTPTQVGVALQLGHALMERRLVRPAVERLLDGRWDAAADPTQPGRRLIESALAFIVDVGRPRQADPAVRRCLTVPGLRARAWRATTPAHGDALLAALPALLAEAPALAGPVATRFALLHRDRCLAAAQALAAAPEATRAAFAAALHKHLERVSAIKLWVQCRQALVGR